jgi:phosphopantetheinyl transferase (holo-ACP synthase)
MLGNDVIDLADPETSSRHARFDARVFTAAERDRIAAAADAGRLRQTLWAAKESAYKAARRSALDIVFSPRRFAVELDGEDSARVRFPGGAARVRIQIAGDCVHAIAILDGCDARRILSGAGTLGNTTDPNAPSGAARALALTELAPHLRESQGTLRVEREGRIPSLEGCAALSLSHHGRFVAYAALLELPTGATL